MSKQVSTKINTLSRSKRTGNQVNQTGDNVVGSLDFVASSFYFLHIHEHVLI